MFVSVTSLQRISAATQEFLWPTRCVGCGRFGALLCSECERKLIRINQRFSCPVCGAPFGWLTCTECKRDWPLNEVISACSYEGPAKTLVRVFKDEHELRLAPLMAQLMHEALLERLDLSGEDTKTHLASQASTEPNRSFAARPIATSDELPFDGLCFVPATAKAYTRRGFDHMELVARELAQATGLVLHDVLVRNSRKDQRELSREERAANLSGSVASIGSVAGLNLLLIDDVITTGASIKECARILKARGAASVVGLSLCRVW